MRTTPLQVAASPRLSDITICVRNFDGDDTSSGASEASAGSDADGAAVHDGCERGVLVGRSEGAADVGGDKLGIRGSGLRDAVKDGDRGSMDCDLEAVRIGGKLSSAVIDRVAAAGDARDLPAEDAALVGDGRGTEPTSTPSEFDD